MAPKFLRYRLEVVVGQSDKRGHIRVERWTTRGAKDGWGVPELQQRSVWVRGDCAGVDVAEGAVVEKGLGFLICA